MMGIMNYITWNVSPFIYEGDHFAIGWYGTLWVLGLTLWIVSQYVLYRHENIPSEYVWAKFLYMCLGVLIGARIGHCWFYEWHLTNEPIRIMGVDFAYRNIYIEKPWLMFDLRKGVHGLSSHGGAIGLLIAALLLDRKFKTGIIWMFDRAVFGVCLCGACIRLGNLFNSEIYGVATTMPWGFVFVNNGDTYPSHPTQLYEMLYCLATLVVLTYLYCKYDAGRYNGLLFGVFMLCIFATRFGLEYIKNDQEQFESNLLLNMGQILSVPFIIWGIYLVFKSLKEGKQPAKVPQGAKSPTRTSTRCAVLIAMPLLLLSCQQNPDLTNDYDGHYAIQQVKDDEFILEGVFDVSAKSKCIIYNYTSVDTNGIEDTLSAVLLVNANCWKRQAVKGLLLWNRPTITHKNDCPTSMNLIAEPILAKYTQTAVISPDLRGFGCNNKPQAYCHAGVNGIEAADALFAAEKILDSIGIRYNTQIYNVGYSQGAQTALAALPYLNMVETKTFLGDGIYDLVTYYNHAVQKGTVIIPADIPLTLVSAIEYAGAKINYSESFARLEQQYLIEDVLSKRYSFAELNHRIGTEQLNRVLSPQLCDSTTIEYYELARALEYMSHIPYAEITTPHKVYLFHSTEDSIMPISQSQTIERELAQLPYIKMRTNYGTFGSHDEAILPFVKYAIKHILL